MIVGADGASDATILATRAALYAAYGLKRVYYSAFSPIPDASRALPPQAPPLMREHRLYQADWLMRFYGFDAEEIVGRRATTACSTSTIDPKLAWALRTPRALPGRREPRRARAAAARARARRAERRAHPRQRAAIARCGSTISAGSRASLKQAAALRRHRRPSAGAAARPRTTCAPCSRRARAAVAVRLTARMYDVALARPRRSRRRSARRRGGLIAAGVRAGAW